MKSIVIVGAGQAGARAALALRSEGWDGLILLIGEEAYAPYERPALSKQGLLEPTPDLTWVTSAEQYEAKGIGLRLNTRALSLDVQARCLELQTTGGSPERVNYDQLLLATGGSARRLDIPGASDDRVMTLRQAGDAQRLADRLVPDARVAVVGGGFIGLEVAASARQRGCQVTLFEAGSRLLGRAVPSALAALIQSLHTAQGVDVRLGDPPLAFEGRPDALQVKLTSGTTMDFEVVVSGIGMVPNVALASAAGLKVNRGIVVNSRLQTSAEHVYAIGDVCEYPCADGAGTTLMESWSNAEAQAAHVAKSMLGATTPYQPLPWMWSDQYEHTLQMVGQYSNSAQVVTRSIGGGSMEFHLNNEGRLVGAAGFAPSSNMARTFLITRKLVEARVLVAPDDLANPDLPLKSFLQR